MNTNRYNEIIFKQQKILENIINNVPELIFYKDQEGRYQVANKHCKDFYKAKGIEEIIGKTDLELPLNQAFIEECVKHDQEIYASKTPLSFEEEYVSSDGSKEVFETIKTPVFNEEGEVLGIVGVVREITQRKKIEERLRYLSYTDTLTGLYNRAYFNKVVRELIAKKDFPIGVILGDVNGLKMVNDTMGHLVGDELIKTMAKLLQEVCPSGTFLFRWGGDEFVILVPCSTQESCERLIRKVNTACKKVNNLSFALSLSLGVAIFKDESGSIDESLQEAEDKLYRQKLLNSKSIRSSILSSLQTSLQAKNVETEAHTKRVVKYSLEMGKILGLDTGTLNELELVAKLHDIGKIGVPEAILLKPSALTDEEFEIMKTHSEKGYRLVSMFPELSHIARGILTHHERWDGKGYPLGLEGEAIPLIARIVTLVDAFDTMTSDRMYNKVMTAEEAIREIKKCAGKAFDPKLVPIFCDIIAQ